jgi:hypothetical protein
METILPTYTFDSLEEERAYFARQAELYKTRLNKQVNVIQHNTAAKAKRSLLWGGSYILCYSLARNLFGTHKVTVSTPKGPVRIKETESFWASAVKGAAMLGVGVLATRAVRTFAKGQPQPHAQNRSLEYDSTAL